MNRIAVASLALVGLMAAVFASIEIRSDAAAIFGPGGAELESLDTPAGRELIIALEGDADARNDAARGLVKRLRADPLVEEVRSGPTEPSKAFIDWLWFQRLQLAPSDTGVTEMVEHLNDARAMLTAAEGMILGDRFLRDPTGSFARLTTRLEQHSTAFDQRDGIWQSKDDRAALMFVTLSDRPFQTQETEALSGMIRTHALRSGVTPYLLGPRIIAAEISAETGRSSMRSAGLASLLLIAWLVYCLRSLKAITLSALPLALGFAAAILAVQSAFGSVHVIALGFGGVLTGLALDYPIHLLGHSGGMHGHAKRLVMIGATTTAIGFLAILGSGVPALMQMGVFVACGLVVAALSARFLIGTEAALLHTPSIQRLTWHLPFRRSVEITLALGGMLLALNAATPAPQALFSPPEHIEAGIERMREMIDLPSGRYAVRVEGETLVDLLNQEASLATELDAAVSNGVLEGYTMLGQVFEGGNADMPSEAAFAETAREALQRAGMSPGFASAQTEAYRSALAAPAIAVSDLEAFDETRALSARLAVKDGGLVEHVRLTGLQNPDALEINTPNAVLVDVAAPVEAGLADLRQDVTLWLGIGAVGAILSLILGLRGWRVACQIALTSAAAVGATVGVLALIYGAPGIFQIVALTLVVGIGIDYGLFLRTSSVGEARTAAAQSVALCAGSTLIAFTVMAFSPVKLLHEIGLTVSLGVVVMLGLNLAFAHQSRSHADTI